MVNETNISIGIAEVQLPILVLVSVSLKESGIAHPCATNQSRGQKGRGTGATRKRDIWVYKGTAMRIRTTGEVQRIKDNWESYEEEEKKQQSNYSDDEEAYGIDILAIRVGEEEGERYKTEMDLTRL